MTAYFVFDFEFPQHYPVKRLAGKSVSNVTYFVSSGTSNLNRSNTTLCCVTVRSVILHAFLAFIRPMSQQIADATYPRPGLILELEYTIAAESKSRYGNPVDLGQDWPHVRSSQD